MTFNSVSFIFLFFPIVLLIYILVPEKFRNAKSVILVLASLLFYAWGSPAYMVLLLFSMAFNYLAAMEISGWKNEGRAGRAKIALVSTIVVDLLMLGYYKYAGFLLGIFHVKFDAPDLPIGISFYTFTVLSYVLDVYMEKADCERNVLDYAVYVSFFPKIAEGPIVEYNKIRDQLKNHPVSKAGLVSGLQLFLIGLFKKVLIADNLGSAFSGIQGLGQMAAATGWLGMIFYSLQLFFDFAGYSDMAIGLSRMFGFKIDKNFNYPYLSDGVTDFWRRWHISLGAWFRDYVYIPLGGNRCSKRRQAFNLSVVWLLTGIWHGANWTFLFWGVYHGAWVLLDKFVIHKHWDSIPKPLRVFGTTLIAFFGWIFFFCPSIGSAFSWIGQMFGSAGLGFWNRATTYYLTTNLLLLILAFLFCSPNPGKIFAALTERRSKAGAAVSVAIYIALFILCVSNMIANSYSAFLYFKF